jgi:hypothetical protein
MKREDRVKISEQVTEKITGVSKADWTEDQLKVYLAVDEAVVNALQKQRQRIANYFQEQGLTWYAVQVRAGADYRED